MGGGSDQSNKFEPPEWTASRYPGAMSALEEQVARPYDMYAGMTVAPLNGIQIGAGQLMTDRALYGDPQLNASRGSLMNIAQGGMANPFIDDALTEQTIARNAQTMADAYSRGTAAQTDTAMALQNAHGGSAWNERTQMNEEAFAKAIDDMARNTRLGRIDQNAGLWNQDRGAVMSAAGAAPTFSQLDADSFAQMMGYGGQLQTNQQAVLADQYGLWRDMRDYPRNQLDWYLSGLGRASGGYGTNWQQGDGVSPLASAAGLGMGIYGMSQMPWG